MVSATTKLILFDWSGTLSDDRKPVYLANRKLLEYFGRPDITYEYWLHARCGSAIEFAKNNGVIAPDSEIQEKFTALFKECVSSGDAKPTPYPKIGTILKALKDAGKQMIVISSHPEPILRKEAEEYGVAEYFVEIIGSIFDKSVTIKEVCEKYNIPPKEACYIGDTCQDMRAAKKAGVFGIAVWTGYHSMEQLRAEEPHFLVEHVGFVPGLLGVEYDEKGRGFDVLIKGFLQCPKCGTKRAMVRKKGSRLGATIIKKSGQFCKACGWRLEKIRSIDETTLDHK